MFRSPSHLATHTLNRFHHRLAAVRRAEPAVRFGVKPDDDLGDRPDEFPALRRRDEATPPRPGEEIQPPQPSHVPLPRHRDGVSRPERETRA
ncbi:hypothetical protein FOZ76_19995 [Verticiella sediminum]|uniref:Uncharacterized protein n=1 Tax=Verticiella sediminum TaxID=1247510 RepID=A0A556AB69_9BURK|nr:hypothetical protein [Verticiella sediminum]TSH90128.1 hypothetical protein FOZ76_19995 [Verticiella sediminum]